MTFNVFRNNDNERQQTEYVYQTSEYMGQVEDYEILNTRANRYGMLSLLCVLKKQTY